MAHRMNKEEIEEYYKKKNVQLKRVEESDLQMVDQLCREVYFDVGYHNLKLYYEMSPNTWNVVVGENNQALVVDGGNRLPNGILYAYAIVVHHDFRGRGLTMPLVPDFLNSPVMASSTADTLKRYSMHAQHWLEKRLGLYGLCARRQTNEMIVPDIPGVLIERLRPSSLDQLVKYDRQIAMIDRKKFVEKWCLPQDTSHGETVVAIDEKSGSCLGYGTMRLFSDYYGIQPLYADNGEIARALMIALTKWCLREDANLYMPLIAGKREALKFCQSIGMIITGTEMRNCTGKALWYVESLPMSKIYSVHEYYPV